MIKKIFISICLILIVASCSNLKNKEDRNSDSFVPSISNPEIANGFRISENGEITLIEIFNAGDSVYPAQKFYLTPDLKAAAKYTDGEVIETPIKRMVCMSATHLSFLDALGDIDKLAGVSNTDYVVSKKFKNLLDAGKISEVGIGDHFKLEALLNLSPQLIMVSPQKGQSFQVLQDAGLKILPNGDYLESHPLGRAEWIKFVGVLTGKEKLANHIFDSISAEYDQLKSLTTTITYKPTVITGTQYGGFWNLSGGKSYIAQFLNDAGADYLWADNPSSGGIMLDFETVYAKGFNADFWRFIVYSENPYSYEKIKSEDSRYADFNAFKNKKAIVCNSLKKPLFQKGLLEPQIILADYIHIFHPELLPNHEPVYYEILR